MEIPKISTQDEARQFAIEWQIWQADINLTWSEVAGWQSIFSGLGRLCNLTEEFEENGII